MNGMKRTTTKKTAADAGKNRGQLLDELALLRKKVAELEKKACPLPEFYERNFCAGILETLKDGIWVTDRQNRIMYANKGMADIAGIPRAGIIGMAVLRDFSEQTLKSLRPLYRKARATLRPLPYEIFVVTPSGRETWQAGWLIPLVRTGRFNGMVCTVQDITAQRHTRDQYGSILKTTRDGFCLLDMQGRVQEVNDAFCAMTGYSRPELLRMGITDIDAVDTKKKIQRRISAIQKSGGALFETKHRRKDGSLIDVEVSVSTLGGETGRMVNLVRDITGRKRMEEALHQSEASARTLLQIPSTAIMLFDKSGSCIDVNDTVLKRFGKTRRELMGRALWSIVPPQVAKRRWLFFRRAVSTGKTVRWEDEREGMLNDNSFIPVANERGAIERVIGFAVDITAGKRAERLLKESEERYRTIFESCAEGILVVDFATLRLKYANPGICAMLGYTRRQLQKIRVPDIHPAEAWQEIKFQFSEMSRGKRVASHAVTCRRRDGSVMYADITGTRIAIDGREYSLALFTDITERRVIEKQLQESEALFRQTFEHAPIGIAIFDKNGAVISVNSFLADMLNYSTGALKADGIDAHLHPECRSGGITALLAAPETLRRPSVLECRYIARAGNTVYARVHAQGVFSPAGDLVSVVVLIEDITARTHAEALNVNIIARLKAVYKELQEFAEILPEHQRFSAFETIDMYRLSPMENRVASLIYHGYGNREIAEKLAISESTVKHHVTSIFSKFNVSRRLEFLKIIREKRIMM